MPAANRNKIGCQRNLTGNQSSLQVQSPCRYEKCAEGISAPASPEMLPNCETHLKHLNMKDLKKMSSEQLTDLLAEKTYKYTRMLREGKKTDEFAACKLLIDQITTEIKKRKEQ